MIQNLEIRKQGERYLILEQAGSNYHADRPVHEAADRADAKAWLTERGAAPEDVARVLDDAGSSERVFLEIDAGYSEAEGFPKQSGKDPV
ncbi:MAG TPA: hypothetical protein VGD62_08205 [Acidobacteriaceae bacterium]